MPQFSDSLRHGPVEEDVDQQYRELRFSQIIDLTLGCFWQLTMSVALGNCDRYC